MPGKTKEAHVMPTAPSTANYMLGKGILKFDRFDTDGLPTGIRDLGNCPNFSLTPAVETLDHFSSRTGLKKKDKSVTLSAGLTAKFTLDEYDMENLAMALLGTVSGHVLTLMSTPEIEGILYFYGDAATGPQLNVVLWRVSLKPTSEVGFIGDDWGKIEFEGEIGEDATGHPTNPTGTITEVFDS
jgi:hypothetical protein